MPPATIVTMVRDSGAHADREAQRALIVEAMANLPAASDPGAAAEDIMRALDRYIETAPGRNPWVREPPVSDYAKVTAAPDDGRWILWLVLACGVLATVVAAVVLQGGTVAGVVMVGIWATVLVALLNS